MKPTPPTMKMNPRMNCINNDGNGKCKMPNSISRIYLIPIAAKTPGIKRIMNAINLPISVSLLMA